MKGLRKLHATSRVSTTFGRSSAHRRALLARLVCCLIEDKRIITTLSVPRLRGVWPRKCDYGALRLSLGCRRKAMRCYGIHRR